MTPPRRIQILAGTTGEVRFPVELLIGVLVGLLIGGSRVCLLVLRLGQLVLEQHYVGVEWPPFPRPDPRLRDVRAGVELPVLVAAPVVVERVLVAHQVLLDLRDLVPGEARRPAGTSRTPGPPTPTP